MIVGDRAGVLACFDETANAAFATLCHLTAGEVDLALDLTVDTYAYLSRVTGGAPLEVDRRWVVAAAHSVFAVGSRPRGAVEPMAALAPLERVVLSLQHNEHWELGDVAALAGVTVEEATSASESATRAIGNTSAETALRACEIWFDDQMRDDVRAAVADGTVRETRSRNTRTTGITPYWSPAARGAPAETALDSPEPSRKARPSRRVTIAALVTSAAAIVALALWVRPSNDASRAETLPTAPASARTRASETTTTSTSLASQGSTPASSSSTADTAAVPTFTSASATSTGFVAGALPDGFQAAGTSSYGSDSETRPHWFELWSSDDATRSSGRWFGLIIVDENISLSDAGPAADAQRVEVAGRPALVHSAPDGVLSVVVQLPGREHVDIRSYGFNAEQLGNLVAALRTDVDNRPSFAPVAAPLLDGLALRSSEPTNQDSLSLQGYNHLSSSAFYVSSDSRHTITINSGAPSPNDLLASRLLNPPPVGAAGADAPDGQLMLDGTPRVAGTIVDPNTQTTIDHSSFVEWHLDGSTVTVIGDVPAEQLLEVARQVHLATADEWATQSSAEPVFNPADVTTDVTTPGSADAARVDISSTVTDAGPTWTVSADHLVVSGASTFTLFLSQRRAGSVINGSTTYDESTTRFALEADQDHPVREYNATDATIVVVIVTSPPEGAKVRLTFTGANPAQAGHILPLVPLGGDVFATAYAFSEQSSYTVDLMEMNGSTVIKTLLP